MALNRTLALGLVVGLMACCGALGCSTSVYRPAQAASFELDPATEISDEDVRKAFAAKPQLPERVRVAYYVFDDELAEPIEAMLGEQPTVLSSYRIPTLLVTGQRRIEEPRHGAPPASAPLSIKKLRLLAARARADLLLIFDYGHRIRYSGNGLVAFGVLLVPMLLLPVQDVATESYLDTYAIDTRNGYLYGQVTADRDSAEDYLFVYSDRGQELVDEQQGELVREAGKLLAQLLAQHATGRAPAGAHGSLEGPPSPTADPSRIGLRIAFGPAGELFINGVQVANDEQARERIAELVRGRKATAVIQSRADIPHQRVVQILDLLRKLNVTRVGVLPEAPARPAPATEPGDTSAPTPGPAPPTRLPNPSSGEPTRVTPAPTFPPHGTPEPVTPSPLPVW